MRFPRLPGRSADDDATPTDAPTAPQQHTALISAVPIPEHTPPPLTSELTRSIRFTISEPQGYYFEQVETFVQQVIDVLAYYEQAEDRWRQFAYEMQLEVDQQAYDAQRLRSEIELFKVQGSPLINPDGSYMTESQNSTLAAVSADLNLVKDQLSASEQARLVGQEEINRLHDLAAMRDQEIASLRAWGEQVIADMQALQAHATGLESQLSTAQASIHAAQATPPPALAPALAPALTSASAPVIEPLAQHTVDIPVIEVPVAEPVVDASVSPEPASYEPAIEVPVVQPVVEAALPYEQVTELDVPVPDATPGSVSPISDGEAAGTPVGIVPQFYTPDEQPPAATVDYEPSLYAPAHAPAVEEPHNATAVYDTEGVVPADPTLLAPPIVEVPTIEVPSIEVPTIEVPAIEDSVEDASVVEVAPVDLPVVDEDDYDYGDDDETEPDDAEAGWTLDSELPEGVALPGTGEAAYSYPTAAPGAPLETHGVPMGVWAPELDPRITQALAEEARQQQPTEN